MELFQLNLAKSIKKESVLTLLVSFHFVAIALRGTHSSCHLWHQELWSLQAGNLQNWR